MSPERLSAVVTRCLGEFPVGRVARYRSVEAEVQRRRDVLFEHVAELAFDGGLRVAERHAEQGQDAIDVAREALFACLHNVFVVIDHATDLGFLVFLVDEDGNELTPGALHEDFVAHLHDTGRYS